MKWLLFPGTLVFSTLAIGLAMSVGGCSDPYDPGQRAVGGGLLGAGAGTTISGLAGGAVKARLPVA